MSMQAKLELVWLPRDASARVTYRGSHAAQNRPG